jgi:hypothetical protein
MGLYIDYEAGDIELNYNNCTAVKRALGNKIEIWDEDCETFIGSFCDFGNETTNSYVASIINLTYKRGIIDGIAAGQKDIQNRLKVLIFGDDKKGSE